MLSCNKAKTFSRDHSVSVSHNRARRHAGERRELGAQALRRSREQTGSVRKGTALQNRDTCFFALFAGFIVPDRGLDLADMGAA